MSPCIVRILIYIQQDATLHSLCNLSANCSTCFGRYHHPSSGAQTTVFTASGICHTITLRLSWKSWNWFECAVHTQTGFISSTIAADSSNGVKNNRCSRYICLRSWWWVVYHEKQVEQFPDINKLCNVASCWIYIRINMKYFNRNLRNTT
jgi:hypothetical protein